MSEATPAQPAPTESSKPKEFSDLSLTDQVHALCLVAREEVGLDKITEWVTHSRGELAPEQLQAIQETYNSLRDTIKWGDAANKQAIESLFGASSTSVTKVIVETAMAKIHRIAGE